MLPWEGPVFLQGYSASPMEMQMFRWRFSEQCTCYWGKSWTYLSSLEPEKWGKGFWLNCLVILSWTVLFFSSLEHITDGNKGVIFNQGMLQRKRFLLTLWSLPLKSISDWRIKCDYIYTFLTQFRQQNNSLPETFFFFIFRSVSTAVLGEWAEVTEAAGVGDVFSWLTNRDVLCSPCVYLPLISEFLEHHPEWLSEQWYSMLINSALCKLDFSFLPWQSP